MNQTGFSLGRAEYSRLHNLYRKQAVYIGFLHYPLYYNVLIVDSAQWFSDCSGQR